MKPPQLGFGFAPEGGGNGRKQRRAAKAKARYWAEPEKFRAKSVAWQQSPKGKAYKKAWKDVNRDHNEAKRRELRAKWKAAGLCSGCGSARETHFVKCLRCRDWCLTATIKRRSADPTLRAREYKKNAEQNRRKGRAWTEANKALKAAMDKRYRESNRDKMREKSRAWYAANKDRQRAKEKELRQQRIAVGLCTECGAARDPTRKLCSRCVERLKEQGRIWRAKAPKEHIATIERRSNLRRLYGLTLGEWNAMFEAQGKRCALCGNSAPGTKGWQTDHCHRTNRVRAILCGPCNLGLGCFKDNTDVLARAIEYLQKHRLTLVV